MLAGKHLDHCIIAEGIVNDLSSYDAEAKTLTFRVAAADHPSSVHTEADSTKVILSGLWPEGLIAEGLVANGRRVRLAFKEAKLHYEQDVPGVPVIYYKDGCEIWVETHTQRPDGSIVVQWEHRRTFKKARAEQRQQQVPSAPMSIPQAFTRIMPTPPPETTLTTIGAPSVSISPQGAYSGMNNVIDKEVEFRKPDDTARGTTSPACEMPQSLPLTSWLSNITTDGLSPASPISTFSKMRLLSELIAPAHSKDPTAYLDCVVEVCSS